MYTSHFVPIVSLIMSGKRNPLHVFFDCYHLENQRIKEQVSKQEVGVTSVTTFVLMRGSSK